MTEPKLLYPINSGDTVLRVWLHVLILSSSFIILTNGVQVDIGAIIDVNSRIGKEQRVAMEIAVQNSNNALQNYRLSLHFRDRERDFLLQVASAAEALIKEQDVKVIIGLETWGEAALVADIGSRAQVPVLSFAESPITTPLTATRWPFLVRMANKIDEQIRCTAALVGSYNWKRVIVIYEDDAIGRDTGNLVLLTEALQSVSSEIEHRLVLPPFSYLTNPKEYVQEELEKLLMTQSRVFIILQSSPPMTIHLFREAKKMGLAGTDSVWIITDSVSSFLDSFNTSVISSMEGALGIKTYFSEDGDSYKDFKAQFKAKFRSEYPEEDCTDPGIFALKAYDSIKTVAHGLDKMACDGSSTSEVLLEKILSSNFSGLSGEISFEEHKLLHTPKLRIINVVGKSYKELDFWLPKFGFSKTQEIENGTKEKNSTEVGDTGKGLSGGVIWPGDLSKRDPKGWAMPNAARPLIIGVPARTSFEKFVKVISQQENKYDGFCIELFYKVKEDLGYALPFNFVPYNGTYDDLVNHVSNKTYDAVVGDVTILADRAKNVEFTVPYAESGLSMIVQVKTEESTWMFMKPFTWEMWAVTAVILIYTMSAVWFLEHQHNPEFSGPWNNQIATALWFTFSSLFFAHREKVHSNLTRLVVVVWLFVVLILNSSYTANLSSMLTVQKLKPNVTDIEWLKRTNSKVGCDGDSFVRKHLEKVLNFKSENILNVTNEYTYQENFENNSIAAAFLEIPYEKVFMAHFCKGYTATIRTSRFAGFGFVFQKGSPIASDFSEAILKLSESGVLKSLEVKWFAPSPECSTNGTNNETESLRLRSFWVLYLISVATSTICALLFLVKLLKNYRQSQDANQLNITPSEKNVPGRSALTSAQTLDVDAWSSARWDCGSPSSHTPDNVQRSPEADFEMHDIPHGG